MPIRSENTEDSPPALVRRPANPPDEAEEGSWDSSDGNVSEEQPSDTAHDSYQSEASELVDLPPGTIVDAAESASEIDSNTDDGLPALVPPGTLRSQPDSSPFNVSGKKIEESRQVYQVASPHHYSDEDRYENDSTNESRAHDDKNHKNIYDVAKSSNQPVDTAPSKSRSKKKKKNKSSRADTAATASTVESPSPDLAPIKTASRWAVKTRDPRTESDEDGAQEIPVLGSEERNGKRIGSGALAAFGPCSPGVGDLEAQSLRAYFKPVDEITMLGDYYGTKLDRFAVKFEPAVRFVYRQVFKVIRVLLRVFILLAIEAFAFAIQLAREVVVEVGKILGDSLYKPLLELFFNSFLQPTMVGLLECFTGIKTLLKPLFEAFLPLAEVIATILRAFQCVRVDWSKSRKDSKGKIEDV